MPNWAVADDNGGGFAYSSGWSLLQGSSRQWNSAVHTTSQRGASATFRFIGTQINVYVTVPVGSGVVQSQLSIDGAAPTTVNRQCSSQSPSYMDLFYQASGLQGKAHTLVITNLGTVADLQLDKVEWLPTDEPGSDSPLPPQQAAAPPSSVSQAQPQAPATTGKTTVVQMTTQTIISPGTTIVSTVAVSTITSPVTSMVGSDTAPRTITSSDASTQSTLPSVSSTSTSSGGLVQQGQGTLVVKVTDTERPSSSQSVAGSGGSIASGGHGISKGALAGIISASFLVLFMFLLLSFLLFRRYKRRLTLLHHPLDNLAFRSTRELRKERVPDPFDSSEARQSSFFARNGQQANGGPFIQLREEGATIPSQPPRLMPIHKPPLYNLSNMNEGADSRTAASTYSQSPSSTSVAVAGASDTLHHRRNNTSEFQNSLEDGSTGTWGSDLLGGSFATALTADLPPPAYDTTFRTAGGAQVLESRLEKG